MCLETNRYNDKRERERERERESKRPIIDVIFPAVRVKFLSQIQFRDLGK